MELRLPKPLRNEEIGSNAAVFVSFPHTVFIRSETDIFLMYALNKKTSEAIECWEGYAKQAQIMSRTRNFLIHDSSLAYVKQPT